MHRAIFLRRSLSNGVIVHEFEIASLTTAALLCVRVELWPRRFYLLFLLTATDEPAHVAFYVLGNDVHHVGHADRLRNVHDEVDKEDNAGDGQQHRDGYIEGRNIFFFPTAAGSDRAQG